MAIFQTGNYQEFETFIGDVETIIEKVSSHAREDDTKELHRLVDNFRRKTDDFYREDRKLNIGVVGQVKAGKSSFLNTLLFGGKEILPKAATPKTATLTKMEYAESNRIEIEYYSVDEWEEMKDNACVNSNDEIFTSAREIVGMVRRHGFDPLPYLERGTDTVVFDAYEDLLHNLNNYVGEDGKFTPIVKAVTLYLNKEEFRGLSIVDTPGLNDPIVSRTLRTKEFMELCDVVFFLSQSGSFLDKSDWTLLSSQLPQKGVKRLVLIASKYDSSVRDMLRLQDEDDPCGEDENTADNIPRACKLAKRKLTKRAKSITAEFVQDLKVRKSSEELISVIQKCSKPIMVSSLAQNMIGKPQEEYTPEERNLYYALNIFAKDIEEDLKTLGNFEEVHALFDEVVRDKEQILKEKSKNFVPNADEELKNYLLGFKEKTEKRIHILDGNDRQQLLAQKSEIESQRNRIKADVYEIFGEVERKLKGEKIDAVKALREANKEYSSLKEHTGTRTESYSYWVSDSKWWNPFSWGRKHKVSSNHEVHYNYCLASDAIDNLRNYAMDTCNKVDGVFTKVVSLKEIKRELLNTIIRNFDTGSEKFDSALFRIMVEEAIGAIDFPIFHIDISGEMGTISGRFSGELKTSKEKMELEGALTRALDQIFEKVRLETERTVDAFSEKMKSIRDKFLENLLSNIMEEFESLVSQCDNKEREIAGYKEYVNLLDEILASRYPGMNSVKG